MPIAERLLTIANNTPEICRKLFKKKTVSGSSIFIDDVSPIEHELNVKLLSDDITDFGGITVTRYGKNLFDLHCEKTTELCVPNTYVVGVARNHMYNPYTITELFVEDNILTLVSNTGYYGVGFFLELDSDTDYIISCDMSDVKNAAIGIGFYDDDWVYTSNISSWHTDYLQFKTPVDSGKVNICLVPTASNIPIIFSNIQLELGLTTTEYEPYKQSQTVIANFEGEIKGLTSLSPNMILVSDNNNINIQCSYRSDDNPSNNEKFTRLKNAFENLKLILEKL